jgi:SAM-dependent methyltransferase
MDPEELRKRVESFDRWHYRIDLGHGVVTPVGQRRANRVVQRRRYLFDRLVEFTGGLEGMRVLDLGCNAGYWSLCAFEAGADFVFGIDGRQMHVDQANLVFEAKGVDPSRYHFELGNFLTYPFETFDLVLCLGILYHVSSPVELFNVMAGTGADLIVIDSAVQTLPGNVFSLTTEEVDTTDNVRNYRNAIEERVVAYPTRGAVTMLAHHHGYECVSLDTRCIKDFSGMGDYRDGWRVAFVASKSRSLDSLPKETPPKTSILGRLRKMVTAAK